MNNYSFLSSDSNPNNNPNLPSNMQQNMQPRAPPSPSPSPSPSQNGSQHNGNGAQQNGIPMVNGLPSGGQQTDMNHLWAVVQQLSQVLEDNKQQTLGIVNGVNAVRARAAEEGGPVNGTFRQVNGELDGACTSTPQGRTAGRIVANRPPQQRPGTPKSRTSSPNSQPHRTTSRHSHAATRRCRPS
jgi:hypothetical protein